MERITNQGSKDRIYSQKEWIIPNGTNLVINDIGINIQAQDEFRGMVRNNIVFLDPQELSALLAKSIKNLGLEANSKIAVLYPTEGGITVKRTDLVKNTLPENEIVEFSISAVRNRPNSEPDVVVPESLISEVKSQGLKDLIIIDDVLVTGSTLKTIQNAVYGLTDSYEEDYGNQSVRFNLSSTRRNRIPLNWFGASWLVLNKPKIQTGNLDDFARISAGILYKGERGQPAVNSLSTWIYDKRKGDIVLNLYAQKYANDPDLFIKFIKALK